MRKKDRQNRLGGGGLAAAPEQSELPVASSPNMPTQASMAVDNMSGGSPHHCCPNTPTSAAPQSPMSKKDFLDRFVKSAGMDPSSVDVLRAAGITTVEKLGGIATKIYNATHNFGKEEMEKVVPTTMAPVEQERLVDALLRLGKSLH
ncbi:hypothetical protein DFH06DRAFT_1296610 [Mycena polygramma]|nr:hypothetical protein DFH06DRAFT_1296610 [Mycena polygramma]